MNEGQRLCGAKTRSDRPCRDIAMANGRCKRHGGKATGPKKANSAPGTKASAKMGIYARFMPAEDQALYAEVELGKVDDELRLMRVRLARTVRARTKWEEAVLAGTADDEHILVEIVDDQSQFEGSVIDLEKRIKKLPDFDKIEQACLARIESLEKTRKELMKDPEGDDVPGDGPTRDRVTFTGGLDGGSDEELPSPFEKPGKP